MGGIIALAVAVLIGAAVLAALWSTIRIHLLFVRVHGDDRLRLEVKALYGLYRFCYEIPQIEYIKLLQGLPFHMNVKRKGPGASGHSRKEEEALNRRYLAKNRLGLKLLLRTFRNYKGWLAETLSHVRCSEFSWQTRFGMGDPALTASCSGIGWVIKSFASGVLSHMIQLKAPPKLVIQPEYNRWIYETELQVRIQIKLGRVLASVLRLLLRLHKLKDLRQLLRFYKDTRKEGRKPKSSQRTPAPTH
jgi:hypothetical protein